MGYISVSASPTTKTANSASYTCTVSVSRYSYYGVNVDYWPIGIKRHDGVILNYIGWPALNQWWPDWGQPDWRLSSGQYINGRWGGAYGMLLPDFNYTFTGTVSINRGTKRKGTATIEVGALSGNVDPFGTVLKTLTLETTEIPTSMFNESVLNCSVDSPQTSGTRKIRLSATFKNPESYYTAKIYDNSGKELTKSSGTSIAYEQTITESMFQTKPKFKAILWGKDGNSYHTILSPDIYIEPSGVGVTVKNSGNHGVSSMAFRNVNNKEIKEVWIKLNGKIYKTKK